MNSFQFNFTFLMYYKQSEDHLKINNVHKNQKTVFAILK